MTPRATLPPHRPRRSRPVARRRARRQGHLRNQERTERAHPGSQRGVRDLPRQGRLPGRSHRRRPRYLGRADTRREASQAEDRTEAEAQAPHAPTVRDQSRLPAPPIQGRTRVRRLPESDPGRVQSAAREGGVTKPCDEFCPFSACHACPWKGGKAPQPDPKEE